MTYQVYEVLIEEPSNGQKFYSAVTGWISSWNDPNQYKMIHIERRTAEQARREGAKYGRVRAVRKLDVDKIRGSIEYLDINRTNPPKPPPDVIKTKDSKFDPIAIDEFVWKKVQKRRNNMMKEKQKNIHNDTI